MSEHDSGHHGIGTWIERRARVAPDRVALVSGNIHRTYAELAERVRRLANHLRARGVGRGDRIAWLGPNHPAFLEALFAAGQLGAALAPINHQLERDAIERICDDVEPRVVLLEASVSGVRLPPRAATVRVGASYADDTEYERLIAGAPDEPLNDPVRLDEICLMPFTSGTTGAPKGVMLSHGNVTWNVINCLSAIDISEQDVTIAVAPFSRAGGTGVVVLPVLFKGGTVVVSSSADPDTLCDLVERHRPTIGFGNPALLESLVRSPRGQSADLSSFRIFITGGAPVPERLLGACRQRGLEVLQGYGLSEAAPLVSVLDHDHARQKLGSAGRPAMFVDVRVVRPDGTAASTGEIGELLVRGPNVMDGYWRRPDATARAVGSDGWLRTGDAARLDEDGFLFLVGRIEDAFVSAGTLVHPGLIEQVLLRHPSVAEVCVMADDKGPVAYVVSEASQDSGAEEAWWSLCREHLPAYARPVRIERVASLPKNPNGKIVRHRIAVANDAAQEPGRANHSTWAMC